ncbi:hypothetical protein KI387_020634, partial [Taxus chinensis]
MEEMSTLKFLQLEEDEKYQDSILKRILSLDKIEVDKFKVVDHIKAHQMKVKKLFNKKDRATELKFGDLVLIWDKKREPKESHGKFDYLWL